MTNYVLDNNQKLKYFNQNDNEVIIETKIRKCIFKFCDGLYKLKYIKDNQGLWLVYSDDSSDENIETINKSSYNKELVIFERKEGYNC